MINLLYILLVLGLMSLSFLFSGCETGVYRISRFRLRLGVEQKRKSYEQLSRMIQEGQNLILSILLGNNLVNYLITMLFTIVLLRHFQNEHLAEMYASLILTPTVFIFCEMIPKSLFYHKSDALLPPLSGFLRIIYTLFTRTGLLRLFKFLFTGIIKISRLNWNTVEAVEKTQRLQVYQIIHETQEEGLLSDVQKDMIHRLINIPDLSIRSVMIPLSEFGKVSLSADRQELIGHLRSNRPAPLLVYDTDPEQIIGHIWLEGILGQASPVSLSEHVTPMLHIDHSASVIEAIGLLRKNYEDTAIVVEPAKGKTRPVGVLRISDLIGELAGGIKI